MEIGRSQASSLVLLFISILQISAGNQIFPSKYVLLKDSTNNVDGGIAFQMDEIRANIQEKLEQNPASHVVSGCIGETFSDNVKDKNLGNSINSDIIGTKLIQEFPYSPYKRTAEIFILLVDSKTKLNGEVPDILLLKKTIIILFGAMELGLWTKMASMSDLVFHITGPEDIPKVEKQLAEQLAIMSEFICDKNKYCMDRRHGSDLYTNCQCQSCGNICNFKLINVSDSCMAYCPHDPHLKAPQKSDKPVTTSVTGNDTWETILIIVIPVISVLAVVAAVIYCIIKKMQKKKKQPIRYVKAHQPQGDVEHNGEAIGDRETTPMNDVPDERQIDGNDDIVIDISGNGEPVDVSNDESATEDSADGIGETAGGTGQSGVNESEAIIKNERELALNLEQLNFNKIH